MHDAEITFALLRVQSSNPSGTASKFAAGGPYSSLQIEDASTSALATTASSDDAKGPMVALQ